MRKKLIIVSLLLTCFVTSFGQQRNNVSGDSSTKDITKKLTQRVEMLEHDLTFLEASFNLYKVQNDFTSFMHELMINLNDIKTNIYNNNYHYDTCRGAEDYHKQMQKKLFANRMLYEAIKDAIEIDSRNHSFTESEQHLLETNCKTIDSTISAVGNYIDFYKQTLDIYKEGFK